MVSHGQATNKESAQTYALTQICGPRICYLEAIIDVEVPAVTRNVIPGLNLKQEEGVACRIRCYYFFILKTWNAFNIRCGWSVSHGIRNGIYLKSVFHVLRLSKYRLKS